MVESYEGVVEHMHGDKVIVVYEIDGGIVEQTYEKSQFMDGVLPEIGTRLAVFVNVAEVQSKPVEPSAEETERSDEKASDQRKALSGPTEF